MTRPAGRNKAARCRFPRGEMVRWGREHAAAAGAQQRKGAVVVPLESRGLDAHQPGLHQIAHRERRPKDNLRMDAFIS